jgi:hypothetical protein
MPLIEAPKNQCIANLDYQDGKFAMNSARYDMETDLGEATDWNARLLDPEMRRASMSTTPILTPKCWKRRWVARWTIGTFDSGKTIFQASGAVLDLLS